VEDRPPRGVPGAVPVEEHGASVSQVPYGWQPFHVASGDGLEANRDRYERDDVTRVAVACESWLRQSLRQRPVERLPPQPPRLAAVAGRREEVGIEAVALFAKLLAGAARVAGAGDKEHHQ